MNISTKNDHTFRVEAMAIAIEYGAKSIKDSVVQGHYRIEGSKN